MERNFSGIMSELRKKQGVSQRKAAADLQVSQALLSHYENGMREPGLAFVCRACDYYGVTADHLLGRNEKDAALVSFVDELKKLAKRAEESLL